MQIQVTQKNIDDGEKGSPVSCAIAKSFYDMGYRDVAVFHTYAHIDGEKFYLPREATQFIFDFDSRTDNNRNKELAKPMSFEIDEIIKVPHYEFEMAMV